MKVIYLMMVLCINVAVQAGDFVNLNFDSGVVPNEPPTDFSYYSAAALFPGWTARMGDKVLENAALATEYLDTGVVSLAPLGSYKGVIEWKFGLLLQGGPELHSSSPVLAASLSQFGLIPSDAKSLLFKAGIFSPTKVLIDGAPQPILQMETFVDHGVDVSAFAGKNVELRLVNYALPDKAGAVYLDSLKFSTASIPEPSTLALVGVGGLALLWALRRPSQQ